MPSHRDLFVGEFAGTLTLVLIGNGAGACSSLQLSKGQNLGLPAVAAAWGLALVLGSAISHSKSPGHLNPAVSLGAALFDGYKWVDACMCILGQCSGAFIAALLVYLAYAPLWPFQTDPQNILAVFCTGPAVRSNFLANVVTEVIGTATLIFVIQAATDTHIVEGFGHWILGMGLVGIMLALGGPTGCALNPARDFLPRLAHFLLPIKYKGSSDWKYSWVPVVGPLIGGPMGFFLYRHSYKENSIAGVLLALAILALMFAATWDWTKSGGPPNEKDNVVF